ncbi:MAG: hypothetical protein K0R08_43 [Solimicrobium sp.]|jgi:hypothetical protein|nr:hypothetical protein [Solimicrobium sp.]
MSPIVSRGNGTTTLNDCRKIALALYLHADLVQRCVRDLKKVDSCEIFNAGHHSFQSLFPPSMTLSGFPPLQDPDSFDRSAFQSILYAEILSLLRSIL